MASEGAVRPVREWIGDKRVAAVLAGVAILFVGYRMIGAGKGPVPAVPVTSVVLSPSTAVREPATTSAAPSPTPAALPIPAGWTGPVWSWNRNPFLDPTAGKESGSAALDSRAEGSSPELRGTIVGGTASMAIFRSQGPDGGNRLVPVGGKVGEWTLSRVDPYRVSLRRGKETIVLELYKQ
jgi:hypothetical protein